MFPSSAPYTLASLYQEPNVKCAESESIMSRVRSGTVPMALGTTATGKRDPFSSILTLLVVLVIYYSATTFALQTRGGKALKPIDYMTVGLFPEIHVLLGLYRQYVRK